MPSRVAAPQSGEPGLEGQLLTVGGDRPAEAGVAGLAAGPLPCQNSHISTGASPPASARRTAFALQLNVKAMVDRCGLERVGFLTLTFSDHVVDPRAAQARMNSLATHVLRARYPFAIRVIERQKSGRIHYHLLVSLTSDIRSGCDFDAFARGDYRTAPQALRREWAFWRATAKRYRFGRTELLPVRSSSEAIARYVGKYIAKHLDAREERDRGVRLVSYIGPGRVASTHFAWVSPRSAEWRRKLKAFVLMMFRWSLIEAPTMESMADRYGPRWCHRWREFIFAM